MADVVTIDFDTIPDGQAVSSSKCPSAAGTAQILGFYNGDPACGRPGAQNLGVTFSDGALAITANASGGVGNFETPPSSPNAAGTLADKVTLSFSGSKLLSKLSFSYSAISGADFAVSLFYNGSLVSSYPVNVCTATQPPSFCEWEHVSFDLGITGQWVSSIEFASSIDNGVVFDNLSFTTPGITPVPEPSSVALAMLGLVAATRLSRRRR